MKTDAAENDAPVKVERQMEEDNFTGSEYFRVERSFDGGYHWTHVKAYDAGTLKDCLAMVEQFALDKWMRENEYVRIVKCEEKPVMVWKGRK